MLVKNMIIMNDKVNSLAQVSNQNIVHPLKKNNSRGALLIFNLASINNNNATIGEKGHQLGRYICYLTVMLVYTIRLRMVI